MFKKILVPVDLTEPDFARPAIDTAVELAKTSGGTVRIVNVLPMTPVMLAEYVPADFDTQQRENADGERFEAEPIERGVGQRFGVVQPLSLCGSGEGGAGADEGERGGDPRFPLLCHGPCQLELLLPTLRDEVAR